MRLEQITCPMQQLVVQVGSLAVIGVGWKHLGVGVAGIDGDADL